MTRRTTGCMVRFCDRDPMRTLHTIALCDTHFGLGRKYGIEELPLIMFARHQLGYLQELERNQDAADEAALEGAL